MEKYTMVFATLISDEDELHGVQLLVKSLRKFGGAQQNAPFWIFYTQSKENPSGLENLGNIQQFNIEDQLFNPHYFFSTKVTAWAFAEEIARQQSISLVWIDPCCLVLREPSLLFIKEKTKAAFRPVHIQNVGLPAGREIDGFWQGIYSQCKTLPIKDSVESFVDEKTILPYFNTHCFCIDPRLGVLAKTAQNLHELSHNSRFMVDFCSDQQHKIFLFQAVLSATLLAVTSMKNIRILPPDYGYPFHLQERIPIGKRVTKFTNMTIMVYEDGQTLSQTFLGLQSSPEFDEWFRLQQLII